MTTNCTTRLRGHGKLLFDRRIFIISTTSCFFTFFLILKSQIPPHQLIWDPHLIEACQETPCFLQGLLSNSIPTSQAWTAHEYVKRFSRRQPDVPTPHVFRQSSKRPSFSECSLVGGAPTSREPSYSKIIDSAPTIRINVRYPPFLRAEGASTPLGSRTDILLIQNSGLRKLEWYVNGWGRGNATLGRIRFLAGETFITEKPLLLYRTECPTNTRACIRSLAALNTSTTPGRLPIWLIHHDVEITARAVLRRFGSLRDKIPSTGITAILIALRICKRINVFGMSGSTSADGDFHDSSVWNGHDLDSERKFVHWLSTCSHFQNAWCGRVKVFS